MHDSAGSGGVGSKVILGEVENLGKISLFNLFFESERTSYKQDLEFVEQSFRAFQMLVGINTDDKKHN